MPKLTQFFFMLVPALFKRFNEIFEKNFGKNNIELKKKVKFFVSSMPTVMHLGLYQCPEPAIVRICVNY